MLNFLLTRLIELCNTIQVKVLCLMLEEVLSSFTEEEVEQIRLRFVELAKSGAIE